MQLLKIEKRKGISPLIATLLLIAIAVAASVLTYSWVMSMITSQSAQAQTQVRIDSITWGSSTSAITGIDVRNTGSVDATLESVSIRTNTAGSPATVVAFTNAIGTGAHTVVGPMTATWAHSTSYVIRVTTNTGFYYESVFTSPAVTPS
jgi:flagellin-like protein